MTHTKRRRAEVNSKVVDRVRIPRRTVRPGRPLNVPVPEIEGGSSRKLVIRIDNLGPGRVKAVADVFVETGRQIPTIIGSR